MNRLPLYHPPRRQSKAGPCFAGACICFGLALFFFAAYRGTDVATKQVVFLESDRSDDKLEQANALMRAGKFTEARDLFRACDSYAAAAGAGQCSFYLNDAAGVRSDVAKLRGVREWSGRAHLLIGQMLWKQGDIGAARPELELASQLGERVAAIQLRTLEKKP